MLRSENWIAAGVALALVLAGCGSDQAARRQPGVDGSTSSPDGDIVLNAEVGTEDYAVTTVFQGVRGLGEFQLKRAIEDYIITLGRFPDRAATLLIDAEFDLEDLFRQNGYPQVVIDHRVTVDDAARTAAVVFEIAEGPQITATVDVVGVETFDVEDDIQPLWIRRASGTFGLGDPLFVNADLEAFARSIRRFYILRGFRDAEVDPPQIEIDAEVGQARVTIQVREQRPSRLTEISFSKTLQEVLGDARCQELRQPEGSVAAAATLDDVRRAVVGDLLRSGYPDPVVRPQPSVDPDDRLAVRLHIAGEPGKRGRITAVKITGNEQTTEWFIRSHFDFEVGSWFDGNAMDRTRRDLYLTGLFSKVDFAYTWTSEEAIELSIEVIEEDSRTIDVLLGYGSYERLRGMLRFEERNLFGTGRRLAIEGRASTRGERGIITVTDPRLFGTRTQLTVGADIFEREEPSFTDRAGGVTAALTRSLGAGFKARAGYTFRKRSGAVTQLDSDLDNFTQGNVFAELRLDRRDSVLYPRAGYLASVQFDADNPSFGSDVDFQRLRLSVSGYVPVYRKIHLALRASTGVLWPGEGSDRVPLQERFFNGGEGTVRSFREARLGPLDVDGAPIGGEYQNTFTAELRIPLRGLFEGALFVDAGNTGSSASDYGLSELRYGVGAGMRFNLPIGPIRLDAGFNPDRVPGEDEWVIHLSVGYPF